MRRTYSENFVMKLRHDSSISLSHNDRPVPIQVIRGIMKSHMRWQTVPYASIRSGRAPPQNGWISMRSIVVKERQINLCTSKVLVMDN